MHALVNGAVALTPLWMLAAWLASAAFAAYIALEKERCTLCWFAWGVLFGPLALLAAAGLPLRVQPVMLVPRPPVPEPAPAAAKPHGDASHASPDHAAHEPAAHPPRVPHTPPGLPTLAQSVRPAAPGAPAADLVDPPPEPERRSLAQAFDKPARGMLVAAIAIAVLLIYFGSSYL